jgi:glycosyltransferase involved in cell wall biosynthesis
MSKKVSHALEIKPQKEEIIPDVSVIVPISERHDNMIEIYNLYADELTNIVQNFEFLFVIDGDFPLALEQIQELKNDGYPVKIVRFPRTFGESTALMEGFQQTRGRLILTLASYIQIEPQDLKKVFTAHANGNDLVITRRFPRKDPWTNRIQSRIYHFLIRRLTGAPFRDITSGVRLISKEILHEFTLYGDLQRFIPVFAFHKGIKVKEVNVSQREEDTRLRLVKPGAYLRRLLDILTLFFIVKFTKKPLRFFGLIGSSMFLCGTAITAYLAFLRLLGTIALSNRPILLLGILLMVFGIQLFSVGLIGELIIFNHAKEVCDYKIEKIIE